MTVGEFVNRLQRLPKEESVTIEELLKIINEIYVDKNRQDDLERPR